MAGKGKICKFSNSGSPSQHKTCRCIRNFLTIWVITFLALRAVSNFSWFHNADSVYTQHTSFYIRITVVTN